MECGERSVAICIAANCGPTCVKPEETFSRSASSNAFYLKMPFSLLIAYSQQTIPMESFGLRCKLVCFTRKKFGSLGLAVDLEKCG
jgi:hypothetical protein